MSIHDERELRSQLAGLLDGVEPGLPPVMTAIRRGRRIRMGRRIAAVAGLAAAVAAAVVLPTVLPARPHSSGPLTPAHYKVTVAGLGPVARGGVIAEGVTNGKSWRVHLTGSHGQATVQAVGAIGAGSMSGGSITMTPDPVVLNSIGDARFTTYYGGVRTDVTSVVVQLPDGEQPRLTPVSWHGYRWVGLVLPARVPFVRAVAYAGTRELAYAIPFRGTEAVAWWKPGQHGPARVTRSIGSGVIDGKAWHATAWTGPWGWCFSLLPGDTSCSGSPLNLRLNGTLLQTLSCTEPNGNSPTAGVVYVAPGVRRVVARLSNGMSESYNAVAIPGGLVFGYEIPAHVRITGSRAYGARGQLVGTTTSAQWHMC